MNDTDAQASMQPVAHRCSACARRFVVVGNEGNHEIICTCGAKLHAEALPRGAYELVSQEPFDIRATAQARSGKHPPSVATPDLGYGPSHGYGPAHGGPTGPGDAPSEPSPPSR